MKLQFDANQQFQLDAVSAIVDLLNGQPKRELDFSVIRTDGPGPLFAGSQQTELGAANALAVSADTLRQNARRVQLRNDIEVSEPNAPLEAWKVYDSIAGEKRDCPHFSVEMETGTGKTYVYLRTVFELSQRYGFRKFIIVVPSVPIREGVLKNIEITAEHFKALYNNTPFEHFVYDSKHASRLRQFATSTSLQILVINIDAFRKNFTGTEDEQKSNSIYKESDKLSGRQPIEFIQSTRPIVIIDEPQSVDSTDKSQDAIKALNPLMTLRYSATHRTPYNLVYRLDPVRAFELRLVKQIVVASARADQNANDAYVKVESVEYQRGIKAKLRIHAQGPNGPRPKSVTVKQGADLFALSNERANYKTGYEVVEIHAEPGNEHVRFANGQSVRLHEEIGGSQPDIWRAQIKHTIRRHLEKERQLIGTGIKVLSLFFIDRVANYRDHDGQGSSTKGKFAEAFEEELAALLKEKQYSSIPLATVPLDKLHNGYFAKDKKGVLKDSKDGRDTEADGEVYNLIMKDKEKLLSLDEPLRFIFSHSALREGWDNPNVFQICTLNESVSSVKKRQEIGRGLRLPVDQSGKRVFDESINKLYVMANESYEDFARALQTEYEDDCGVTFGRVPLTAIAKLTHVVGEEELPIGLETAQKLKEALVVGKMLDSDGRIQPAFAPRAPNFSLNLPASLSEFSSAVVDLLSSYQIERHVRPEKLERTNTLKKEVVLRPEFKDLWARIKPRTTYRVVFDTEKLIRDSVEAIKRMEKIEAPHIHVSSGQLRVDKGSVQTQALSASEEVVARHTMNIPDVLAYLQNETELTRGTIYRILKESGRLEELFADPQSFLDKVSHIVKNVLRRSIVDGIKYERIPAGSVNAEWEMRLFQNEELVNLLTAIEVSKSIYDCVPYDSEVERKFAEQLDQREDIKLFVKLPRWFMVDTPIGTYNPDWAILKHDGNTLYLVRETKGSRDFLKLRTSEADKIHCGQRHFEAIGVDYKVVVSASEV